MKKDYLFLQIQLVYHKIKNGFDHRWILAFLFIICFSFSGYTQRNKDIEPLIYCVKDLGNGIYQASFGYVNPTKKEVVIDQDKSVVKFNNGKRVAKGLNKFKPGSNEKVFTKEFGSGDYVEWTIVSNGNTHTVVANANSAKKCEPDDGFIFPVIGNGKSSDIIGQELTALCDGIGGEIPSPLIFQLNTDGKVLVEIIPDHNQTETVIDLLKGITPSCAEIPTPFNVADSDFLLYDPTRTIKEVLNGLSAIDVYIEEELLCKLNDYECVINFARPVYPSIKNGLRDGNTGLAVSQGDATQATDIVRESFKLIDSEGQVLPVDGTGVTVGVMSNSYDTQPFSSGNLSKATLDVLAFDLPGEGNSSYPEPVQVLMDYPYGVASDEGRAMMHIIHDVAPGARLAFHTGTLSPRNFETGFNALADISDIIVDDITFITEPFFGGSKISEAIDIFTNAGGIHFTSAGNFSDMGYQAVFNPSAGLPSTNFIEPGLTKAHVFGTNNGSEDYFQKISVEPGTYMIALQWKEDVASQYNETGADNDLDIYIVDDSGRLLVGSNRINIAGDPTEVIVFRATGTGEANILITSANGDTVVPFRYIVFQSKGLSLLEYDSGTPTISGHAMTENSVTVGAIRYNQTEPEVFSSFGGILSDGNLVAVDFAAPDGVDTNVNSIGIKYFSSGVPVDETPEYPNFYGTSAAAPSAAAAVALLQSALPTWYPDEGQTGKSSKSVGEVIDLFKNNVRDGSSVNPQAGAGMIDANKVFNSLASQTARITSFEFVPLTDADSASISTVRIRIIGEFLPVPTSETEPVVYLDGEPVPFTVIDGVIYADIPPFSGNPDLQIYTQPKEGSEGNGGFSEPYKFFQDGKNVLTITANPVSVKFGEEYKSKLNYSVEGIDLPEGETSYAALWNSLGFPDITLNTTVDNVAYPDTKNYPISASFEGVFTDTDLDGVPDVYDQCPESPQGESVDSNGCTDAQKGAADFQPVTTYKVNFIDGNLAIEKNYLSIRPVDQSLTYGEDIPNDFIYQITDANGVPVPRAELELRHTDIDGFYAYIHAAHISDFHPVNTSSLLLNDFKALINDWDWASETNDFKALINTWKALINTWKALINDQNFDMILEGSSWTSTENTFKALINSTDHINLDPAHFQFYSAHLNDFKPLINDFKPLINDFKALINRSEFVGDIYLNDFKPLINDFKPLINDFKPLINDSSSLFTVVSTDDAPSAESPENAISRFYSVNLLTGIHVYEEPHYILPGSLINAIEANFDITYDPGRLTVTPAVLKVKTEDKVIEYGQELTVSDLTTSFTGLVNNDLLREVFSNAIPYYFIEIDGDGTELEINELKELGEYMIKVRTPQNYSIEYEGAIGKLTITKATQTAETEYVEALYGSSVKASDLTTVFSDFAHEESLADVFPDGIPYFFVDGQDVRYELQSKMPVGDYSIRIDEVDNYTFDYGTNHGSLTIKPAPLTVKTAPFTVAYGDDVSTAIIGKTVITGFAEGEGPAEEFDVFPEGINYLFVQGDGVGLTIDSVKELGIYKIQVEPLNPLANYSIVYDNDHGDLTITEATLTFSAVSETIVYGETPIIEPNFDGFGYGESEEVLKVDGVIPYVFVKDGVTYDLTQLAAMNVGIYEIFITDDIADNYVFSPDSKVGALTITPAVLHVRISPKESIVSQGEVPILTTTIVSGSQYGEVSGDIFGSVVPYVFFNEFGDVFYDTSIPGIFTVQIADPLNYTVTYENETILLVNSDDSVRKVRTFSDCVLYNGPNDYTVIFRYENDNDYPVYVAVGENNRLTGNVLEGEPPSAFMPGSGTFEIRFDGSQLTWSLTTNGSTNSSSVSSSNQSDTGECSAKEDGVYSIYPNPVIDVLNIKQKIVEKSEVELLNMYGLVLERGESFDGFTTDQIVQIDMQGYSTGMYIIRIVSTTEVKTYTIIKQ